MDIIGSELRKYSVASEKLILIMFRFSLITINLQISASKINHTQKNLRRLFLLWFTFCCDPIKIWTAKAPSQCSSIKNG